MLEGSSIYYSTPSVFAKTSYFYVTVAGNFLCDDSYRVQRDSFVDYLLVLVANGMGTVEVDGQVEEITDGCVFLLDARRPHIYGTSTGWEATWIHFNGNSSTNMLKLIFEQSGHVIKVSNTHTVRHYLSLILNGLSLEMPVSEPLTSSYIHRILAELLTDSNRTVRDQSGTSVVEDALSLIHANYARKLSIRELASFVHTSPYHFSRLFRAQTGYSPYEYIINVRMDQAMRLLRNTNKTISEISHLVGFQSESNFVSTFKRTMNITPGRFRSAPF